jgi:hypothetical protein
MKIVERLGLTFIAVLWCWANYFGWMYYSARNIWSEAESVECTKMDSLLFVGSGQYIMACLFTVLFLVGLELPEERYTDPHQVFLLFVGFSYYLINLGFFLLHGYYYHYGMCEVWSSYGYCRVFSGFALLLIVISSILVAFFLVFRESSQKLSPPNRRSRGFFSIVSSF